MNIKQDFTSRLLNWYEDNGRKELPWKVAFRATNDPYHVWLSEVMLQQTQVTTVLDYYAVFVERFPTIIALADAPSEEVMTLWSGLGYYARARNLHNAAKMVRDEFSGNFPSTYDEVLRLPGVGRSTAGAILSFCFQLEYPILDGNVKRVLTRLHQIEEHPSISKIDKQLWVLADKYSPSLDDGFIEQDISNYTQAIMDFGATICKRKPLCLEGNCVMSDLCEAHQTNKQKQIPVPKKKKVKPQKFVAMPLVIFDDVEANQHKIYLVKRPDFGIWSNLWSLPEINLGELDAKEFSRNCKKYIQLEILNLYCQKHLGIIADFSDARSIEYCDVIKHSFSHYDLFIAPVKIIGLDQQVQLNHVSEKLPLHQWLSLDSETINNTALPAPIYKILIQQIQ